MQDTVLPFCGTTKGDISQREQLSMLYSGTNTLNVSEPDQLLLQVCRSSSVAFMVFPVISPPDDFLCTVQRPIDWFIFNFVSVIEYVSITVQRRRK